MVKEREKKRVESLGTLGRGVCFGGTPRDYVFHKKSKMRNMQTSSSPSSSEITCNLGKPCTKKGLKLGATYNRNLENMSIKQNEHAILRDLLANEQ